MESLLLVICGEEYLFFMDDNGCWSIWFDYDDCCYI